jgi:hypothetical protein
MSVPNQEPDIRIQPIEDCIANLPRAHKEYNDQRALFDRITQETGTAPAWGESLNCSPVACLRMMMAKHDVNPSEVPTIQRHVAAITAALRQSDAAGFNAAFQAMTTQHLESFATDAVMDPAVDAAQDGSALLRMAQTISQQPSALQSLELAVDHALGRVSKGKPLPSKYAELLTAEESEHYPQLQAIIVEHQNRLKRKLRNAGDELLRR